MKTYYKRTIEVTGHPHATGSVAERQVLSNQRVEAVRELFLLAGVSPSLVTDSGTAKSKYTDGRVEVVVQPLVSSCSKYLRLGRRGWYRKSPEGSGLLGVIPLAISNVLKRAGTG
jgi:hypothetical protein